MIKNREVSAMVRMAFIFILAWSSSICAQNDIARDLFADYKSAVLQIRVIDLTSGSKSAIGSGFPVNELGLIATNYHVIQLAASEPQQYRIEYLTETNKTGKLKLVDVDVINDLALVEAVDFEGQFMQLATQEPEIGMPVYALGNPLDLGLTVVPGTYNGINRASYHPRVHFTGSLNPGMSGGPTMDRQGLVVGINVATAGNQVSFLVPVSRLHTLVSDYRARGAAIENIQLHIGEQLMADQQEKFSSLFARNWQVISLGEAQVLDELAPFVKCWGGSNSSDDKAQFLSADRSCRSEDNIHMTSTFATGILEYQFIWLEADKLNSWQFYNYYERLFGDFVPGNRADEEDVTDFQCDHGFTQGASGRQSKNIFCLRAYKEYPKLYDILFLQGSVDDKESALISHFTLAGVSKENGLAFTRKFMEVSQWQ